MGRIPKDSLAPFSELQKSRVMQEMGESKKKVGLLDRLIAKESEIECLKRKVESLTSVIKTIQDDSIRKQKNYLNIIEGLSKENKEMETTLWKLRNS